MAAHNEIGKIGEDICRIWLKRNGFIIIESNYTRKCGEIDIVARGTSDSIHFIEVKTVSYETKVDLERAVSYGTWRPEDRVDYHKRTRLQQTIEMWVYENKYMGRYQIDILTLRLVPREKIARIKYFNNIVFE